MHMVFEELGMEKIERKLVGIVPILGQVPELFSRNSRMQPKLDVVIVCFLHVRQTRSYRAFFLDCEDAPCLCVNFISLYYIAISVRRYADIMYDMVTSSHPTSGDGTLEGDARRLRIQQPFECCSEKLRFAQMRVLLVAFK